MNSEENISFKLQLTHAFGSTCSFKYQDSIAICDADPQEAKILFPAGKSIAKKYIEKQQMDFVTFQNNAEAIQCIHILPSRSHIATSEKVTGSNLRVIKIYNMKGNQKPQVIKIFQEKDGYGFIKNIVFSLSQQQFMCCQIGDPHHKLIYIDVSKNKSLAESTFTVKQIQRITICPKNSHLICASGGNIIKLFKVQQYAFKPLQDIRKLPKGRKYLTHAWYKGKLILAITDQCQVLLIQQYRNGLYEVKQEYQNAFNQVQPQKILITAICTFSKGFILGSSNGKFCLWIRKQQGMNYEDQKLELVRKWGTTDERASVVTGIAINSKEDMLAISFSNNDITTIFLNDLMPQVSEAIQDKQKKQVFFQYLYKGFHSYPVTGMDICLQRPLLATCSHEDSTIRIWNYKNYGCKLLRMFYFRLKQNDSKPLITLSFHPCGYYLAVGCKDKLRFFYVLNNELRPYRQINIKGAHIVKFSHGGHMIATASPTREESTQEIIHIFNAITLQEIKSFSVHSKKIKNLQWKQEDEYLCSISQQGSLYQWKVNDWKESKKIIKNSYKYECSKYYKGENCLMVFATAFSKYYLLKISCQSSKIEQIQVDIKIMILSEVVINKKSCLIAGLANGSILMMTFPNNRITTNCIQSDHCKSVTSISISPCSKYLISTGADCLIFVYQTSLFQNGIKQIEDISSPVDDFLADVVLYPKEEIVRFEEKQKEYSKIIGNLEKKLESITQQAEKKHRQKIQQLQMQKNRVIQDFYYRIERAKQQIESIRQKNKEAMTDLDERNFVQASHMQKKYDEKLEFEKQKYLQLEQEMIQQKIIQKSRIKSLEEEKVRQIELIKNQFKNKFSESEKIYSRSKSIVNSTTELFEEKLKHIEQEQEQELRELQQRLQQFKIDKAVSEQNLQQKLSKAKVEHQEQLNDRNERKKYFEELQLSKKKLDKQTEQAKQKLKQMSVEYEEKIQIITNKEGKIVDFEKKMNDLQKKKHILSYKATEMKKALEPKEAQIEKLKLELMKLKKQFDVSLQRKENFVLYMERIQKERQFLEKELTDNQNELVKSVNYLDQILYDIYSCILNNKDEADSKGYSRGLLKLYHKYVQKIGEKQESQNQKGVEEMTKQIVHLQKSLYQMNQSNKKSVVRKQQQIKKRVSQNAQLINNLNDLKKENTELTKNIKSKNLEIESLRSLKNEAISQAKKDENNNLMGLYLDEQISNSNFNSQSDKKKAEVVEMNPREKNLTILSQFKRKQCQLVSEIQFITERIHKADFFLKQLRDYIKKHYANYRCQGSKIQLDHQISQII